MNAEQTPAELSRPLSLRQARKRMDAALGLHDEDDRDRTLTALVTAAGAARLGSALVRRACFRKRPEVLGLLGSLGCRLDPIEDLHTVSQLGYFLGRGQWSFPELVAPDLFAISHAGSQLGDQLLRSMVSDQRGRVDWEAHIARIADLPHGEHLAGCANRSLEVLVWDPLFLPERQGRIRGAVARMLALGWIDPSGLQSAARGTPSGQGVADWLANLAASPLETATAPALGTGARGARL